MSRKQELIKMANLFRSQAKAVNSRSAKQALRRMADYYQDEFEQLTSTSADVNEHSKSTPSRPKSAA
jgi:hypothetical protein